MAGERRPPPRPMPRKRPGDSVTANVEKLDYDAQIHQVRRLYAAGEVAAALDLAGRIRADAPSSISRTAIPVITLTIEAILALPLDHRAGFMLTRIDGNANVGSIIDIAGMSEEEAVAILENLVALGALSLVKPRDDWDEEGTERRPSPIGDRTRDAATDTPDGD